MHINKHQYTHDFASPITSIVTAGTLLFIGFDFTSDDASAEMTGNIKHSYTITAKRV